ncbi:hypothetical protein B9G55_22605 [Saccharibacillus sp. O16]|nr:hypothetical protein B9G55_22605 [Saccharibacillus sp. O16]
MFPQHPEWTTLPCDISLTRRNVEEAYPWLRLRTEDFEELWEQGINTRPQADFVMQAEELLDWLRQQERSRVFAVSHDGTIHAYRELLGEQNLSRDDFLGEAGTYVLNI